MMIVNLTVIGIIWAKASACSASIDRNQDRQAAQRAYFSPSKPCVDETQINSIALHDDAGDATRALRNRSCCVASGSRSGLRLIKMGVLPQLITLTRDTHCILRARA